MKNVTRMMTESEKLMFAAERKSPQDVFDGGAELYETCVNCHTQYMPAIKDLYR